MFWGAKLRKCSVGAKCPGDAPVNFEDWQKQAIGTSSNMSE